MIATLRVKNQVTLPQKLVKKIGLSPNDKIEISMNEYNQIILTPVVVVEKKWLDELKVAMNDLQNKNISKEMTAKEVIENLELLQIYSFLYTKKFQKDSHKLNKEVKKKLAKQLYLLAENPKHPSLRTKKNHIASQIYNKQIFESSINMYYRFLWEYQNDKIILLLFIGNHKLVEGKKQK